jgi:hypothetical protein
MTYDLGTACAPVVRCTFDEECAPLPELSTELVRHKTEWRRGLLLARVVGTCCEVGRGIDPAEVSMPRTATAESRHGLTPGDAAGASSTAPRPRPLRWARLLAW